MCGFSVRAICYTLGLVVFIFSYSLAVPVMRKTAMPKLLNLNITSMESLFDSKEYETTKFTDSSTGIEISAVVVIIAEIILILSVLLLWGVFAFLSATVAIGGSIIGLISALISTDLKEMSERIAAYLSSSLPSIVNPIISAIDPATLAILVDNLFLYAKITYIGSSLYILLMAVILIMFVVLIRTLSRVKTNQTRLQEMFEHYIEMQTANTMVAK